MKRKAENHRRGVAIDAGEILHAAKILDVEYNALSGRDARRSMDAGNDGAAEPFRIEIVCKGLPQIGKTRTDSNHAATTVERNGRIGIGNVGETFSHDHRIAGYDASILQRPRRLMRNAGAIAYA